MEYDKIKQLMDDMGNSKLTEIEIEFPDGTKISMKKEGKKVLETAKIVEEVPANITEQQVSIQEPVEKVDENLKYIKSPMVGTFYSKPSPTSEPFVKIGGKVSKGQTVCIVEAMKLMNEIESDFDGEIVEIYVKDGEPVEYGTKLFAIK